MSLTWSELQLSQEIELIKPPIEKVQLVKYAGASGDFNMIHTDEETARKSGLPGIIAHGMLNVGFLGQLLGQIAGVNGFVNHIQVRFAGMILPGDSVICRAKVTAKDEEERTVRFDISAEREPGKAAIVGSASIKFVEKVRQG